MKSIINYSSQSPVNITYASVKKTSIHWHSDIEIIVILKGNLKVKWGYKEIILRENDVILISNEELHSLYSEAENVIMMMHLNINYCKVKFPNVCSIIGVNEYSNVRVEFDKYLDDFRYFISEVALEYYDPIKSYEGKINQSVDNLLGYVVECYKNIMKSASKLKCNVEELNRMYRLLDYMYLNYNSKIKLDEIAKREYISSYHLSHFIKNITGYNFRDWLNYIRVEKSEKLLLETKKFIQDIAWECGFSDVRYYIKYFKKWHSYTPSEFRKKYAKLNNASEIVDENIDLSSVMDKVKTYSDLSDENKIKNAYDVQIDLLSKAEKINNDKILDTYNVKELNLFNCFYILTKIQGDLKFKYIRISNIINKFNETNRKQFLSFLKKIQIEPIVCINKEERHLVEEEINRNKDMDTIKWYMEVMEDRDDFVFPNLIKPFNKNNKVKMINEGNINFYKNIDKNCLANDKLDIIHISSLVDFFYRDKEKKDKIKWIKKPTYYFYYFIAQLGDELIAENSNYLITKNPIGYQMIFVNYSDAGELLNEDFNTEEKELKIQFKGMSEDYLLKQYSLDRIDPIENVDSVMTHLSKNELKLLENQYYPKSRFNIISKNNSSIIIKLPFHSFELLLFQKIEK